MTNHPNRGTHYRYGIASDCGDVRWMRCWGSEIEDESARVATSDELSGVETIDAIAMLNRYAASARRHEIAVELTSEGRLPRKIEQRIVAEMVRRDEDRRGDEWSRREALGRG